MASGTELLARPLSDSSTLAPTLPEYKVGDIYIAVMGVTGAGKSTFISKLCPTAVVGHGIKSQTKDIGVHTFEQDGKRIHLIDTPGFDDTYKSDADVLKDLAYYLTKSYDRGIKLTGIIYLHPITHNRMTGTAFKNLRTFRKLCGTESMSAVVLVTTMWELVTPRSEGVKREQELRDEPDFWGTMQREGSTIVQHANTRESALAILATLVGRGRGTTVLDIQHEMVDLGRSLDDTEAGREVDREMRAQREVFERRLEDTKRELQEAVETSNQQHADEIMREQREFEDKLVAIQRGRDELRISMEKLIEERDKQHMEEMAKVQQQLDQSKDELKKQAEEYEKVKQFQVAQKEQYEAEKKEQEEIHEQIRLQAAESEFISRILLISSQMKEEDGKRKEHEHKVKEELYLQMMKSNNHASTAQKSAPPSYREYNYRSGSADGGYSSQPYLPQYAQQSMGQQYMPQYAQPMGQQQYQGGYNEGVGLGMGSALGALTGIAAGGAAAVGLCNVM